MKISCPTCAAKYSVADEKIQSRLAKIRCRKCSSTIVIDGMTTPASVYIGDPGAPLGSGPPQAAVSDAAPRPEATVSNPAPPSEPVGPAPDEYAVDIADNDQRNMTIHQIVGAYNEGLITADTYIWKEGMADWQTVSEVKAVADALHAAAARPPAAAAVRRPDHGATPDLFGRIASAGGEDDITTSAPEPTFTAGTGARNESSVLFSLSALTGSAEASSAAPSGGGSAKRRSSSDDSGLIDLTALTASEAGGGAGGFGPAASAYGASPLISAPLGGVSGPALGAGLAPGYGAPRSGGRALVIAASVLAAAIIGGAALIVVNRGGSSDIEQTSSLEKAPAAGAEAPRAADPEPAPAAAATEPAEPATEPASVKDGVRPEELPTAAPEPVAAPKPVVRAPAPRPRPAPVRAKPAPPPPAPDPEPVAAAPKPAPATEPVEVKKKATSRCECKPADLMCAMRCSAKNK